MATQFGWAALDADGVVIRTGDLAPGRWVIVRGAAAFLEYPKHRSGPTVGDRLSPRRVCRRSVPR
jgi:hypothetical protein